MDNRVRNAGLWIERGERLGEGCKRAVAIFRTMGRSLRRSLEAARHARRHLPGNVLHGR